MCRPITIASDIVILTSLLRYIIVMSRKPKSLAHSYGPEGGPLPTGQRKRYVIERYSLRRFLVRGPIVGYVRPVRCRRSRVALRVPSGSSVACGVRRLIRGFIICDYVVEVGVHGLIVQYGNNYVNPYV